MLCARTPTLKSMCGCHCNMCATLLAQSCTRRPPAGCPCFCCPGVAAASNPMALQCRSPPPHTHIHTFCASDACCCCVQPDISAACDAQQTCLCSVQCHAVLGLLCSDSALQWLPAIEPLHMPQYSFFGLLNCAVRCSRSWCACGWQWGALGALIVYGTVLVGGWCAAALR